MVQGNHTKAWLLLALASPGCAMLGSAPATSATWHAPLPLAVVGGICAQVVRECAPDADPVPQSADAPVLVSDATRWVVRLHADARRGLVCAGNARIAAPVWNPPTPDGSVAPVLRAGALARSGPATPDAPTGSLVAELVLTQDSTGTNVHFDGSGPLAREIADGLASSLAFANALAHARTDADAEGLLRTVLRPEGDPVARTAPCLRAALHCELAATLLATERLVEARQELDRALALGGPDPDLLVALAAIDRRLAHAHEVRTGMKRLATLAATPLLAARAQAELRKSAPLTAPALHASASRDEARTWLARGDTAATLRWLARAETEDTGEGPKDLAMAWLGERLSPREGYERRLAELARLGRTQERLLALGEACLARGDPLLALHVLAQDTCNGTTLAPDSPRLLGAARAALSDGLVARTFGAGRLGGIFGRVQGAFASPPR